MSLLSLVFVLSPSHPGSITGVRRIGDVTFERPLRIGETVQVEVVVDGAGEVGGDLAGAEASLVVANADLVCRQPRGAGASLLELVPAPLAGPAPDAGFDQDLECVQNIPV
jgi:hypothetical protein